SRVLGISKKIQQQGLDISWTASSRVDTFSKETAEAMRKAGAHTVYFGIESGVQKILDFIGKRITPEQSTRAVKTAKKAGLHTFGSFIIGFPQENKKDIKKTLRFSRKIGVDFAQFTIATPYPGTRLWYMVLKQKLLTTMDWRRFTTLDPVLKLKNFTYSQITKILEIAYIKFYLRPKVLIKDIIQEKGFILRRAIPQVIKMFMGKKEGFECCGGEVV
ncbi:MAG TPA: radical SAM protein, partial [Thermoplasmata archaeon]|nr:radical SAM protein [Thermoplasmata archaeon]